LYLPTLTVKRHDIAGSSTLDQPPHFPPPKGLLPDLPLSGDESSGAIQTLRGMWHQCYPHQPEVSQMMDDLQNFNALLRKEGNWVSGRILAEKIVSGFWLSTIVHRLLSLHSVIMEGDTASVLREHFRLGGLLYFAAIRRQFGNHPVVMRVHVCKLKLLLQRHKTDWLIFTPLKIWTVTMAVFEAEEGLEKIWLMRELIETLQKLDLTTYAELKELLEGLFWCPEVHEEQLRKLWDSIAHSFPPTRPQNILDSRI
jgi:hypothetical protein